MITFSVCLTAFLIPVLPLECFYILQKCFQSIPWHVPCSRSIFVLEASGMFQKQSCWSETCRSFWMGATEVSMVLEHSRYKPAKLRLAETSRRFWKRKFLWIRKYSQCHEFTMLDWLLHWLVQHEQEIIHSAYTYYRRYRTEEWII